MEAQFYLGKAIKHPIELVSGRAELIGGYNIINQSIRDILSTPVGTRLMLPEYGSRLDEMAFEPNDSVLAGALRMLIAEALGAWEKRTRFVSVDVSVDGNVANCMIYHQPLASNEIQSFVFPFYKSLTY